MDSRKPPLKPLAKLAELSLSVLAKWGRGRSALKSPSGHRLLDANGRRERVDPRNEEERRDKQDVLINITLYTDHTAAISDDVADTVNDRTVAKQTIKLVEASQFFLVEKMALEIANLCLADPRVERAIVMVEKPGALRFARSVGVTVDRVRTTITTEVSSHA